MALLSNFEFTIQHRSGRSIVHVDYLSRNNQPHRQADEVTEEEDTEAECHINSIMLKYGLIETTDWRKLQLEDANLRVIRNWGKKKQVA